MAGPSSLPTRPTVGPPAPLDAAPASSMSRTGHSAPALSKGQIMLPKGLVSPPCWDNGEWVKRDERKMFKDLLRCLLFDEHRVCVKLNWRTKADRVYIPWTSYKPSGDALDAWSAEHHRPTTIRPGSRAEKIREAVILRLKDEQEEFEASREREENSSASAMGKYGEREMLAQSTRPGSQMSTSRMARRPIASLPSPPTVPSKRDSQLHRATTTPAASIPKAAPPIKSESSSKLVSPPHASTAHGRNLLEAARVLNQRSTIPREVLGNLTAVTAPRERTNTGCESC